jgi:hypothetical protein
MLLPYLKIKRKQAELAIKFQSHVFRRGSTPLTEEEINEREKLRKEIMELNRSWCSGGEGEPKKHV